MTLFWIYFQIRNLILMDFCLLQIKFMLKNAANFFMFNILMGTNDKV